MIGSFIAIYGGLCFHSPLIGARILVIEDEAAINNLICMNPEVAGYEPVPYLDGLKAESAILKKPEAALAIPDVMLPGKDGFPKRTRS